IYISCIYFFFFFFSSRRRHTRSKRDWSSDVCSSDLVEDSWKISPRCMVNYGVRYEVNSRIKEAKRRTSIGRPVAVGNPDASFTTPGASVIYLYNPQPAYPMDWSGLAPRVSVEIGRAHV